ncbi:MAG TPA: PEP-CTERM system histidine kinase PrsK, partial [Methylothermaceae bacterium]|nr:PEP-CTERM system histidine kinase PrsK [Methylothermaceae bacterium]
MGQGGPLIMNAVVGAVSYAIGAGAFALLSLLLATSWRGRLQGGLLLLASAGMAVWAGVNAWYLAYGALSAGWIWTLEAGHIFLWLIFLWRLLPRDFAASGTGRWLLYTAYGLGGGLVLYAWTSTWLGNGWFQQRFPELQIMGQLLLVLAGLTSVEQLYRNTRPDKRWYIKFLCLALGGLFAYEFYLYADALLFKRFNPDLWAARGLVSALLVPLLAVTAARNPTWSVETFVSRDVVFHSATVVGAGLYLLV